MAVTGVAWAGCVQVTGDVITAADLAQGVPAIRAVSPERRFGFAPRPGVIRTITAGEIERFAARYGVTVRAADVCVESPVEVLSAEQVLQALRAAVPEAVEFELLDYSRAGVPAGQLEFPVAGIGRPDSDGIQMCRGHISYGTNRRIPFWAKARITVLRREALALREIPRGSVIGSDDIRIERKRAPDLRTPEPEVIGMAAARRITAGSVIDASWVNPPDAVRAGEPVRVRAGHGPARVEFTSKALNSAKRGQAVRVANPFSGKTLVARAEGEGTAVIPVSGGVK